MSCTAATSVAPERVIEALTDFGPERPERWPNLDRRFYELHELRATSADVTEGSAFAGGIWERARYD